MDGSTAFWCVVVAVALVVVALGIGDDDVIDDVFGRRED